MKLNSKKIAITGTIGAGKSTVCSILKNLGEICISCDEINKELLLSKNYLSGLKVIFPEAFINGILDKNCIKEIIYNSEKKRLELNLYSHKKIEEKMLEEIDKIDAKKRIFVEIPLLNQTDFCKHFDEIWVIMSSKDNKINRIISRDNCTKEFAQKMLIAQVDDFNFPISTKIVYNDGSLDELKQTILTLLKNG